jgi:hypothetical protein
MNSMTTEAKRLIEEFEALSDEAKQEVVAEILHLSLNIDESELTDEERCRVAAEVWAAYDAEEDAE